MAITDPSAEPDLVAAAGAVLKAGVPALQLRWKTASARQLLDTALTLRPLATAAGALLIVNDRLDVALAAGADGVHLGDDDLPIEIARRLAPSSFLIGRSVDTPDEARSAEAAGADYLGAGPVFATGSKLDTGPVMGVEGLRAICGAVRIPVLGIGGIAPTRAAEVIRAGAAGVAVLGSIMSARDVGAAAEEMLREVRGAG